MTGFVLETFLPYQLAVASDQVSREFSRLYRARFGISIPEWRVLAHLSQDDEVSVREIHARVAMDKSKVSRAAARLETAGYVSKRPHPADGRLVVLSLTSAGRDLVAAITPLARGFEAEVLGRLGPGAQPFRDALAALMDADVDLTPAKAG